MEFDYDSNITKQYINKTDQFNMLINATNVGFLYETDDDHKFLNIKLIILWLSSPLIGFGIIANIVSLIVFFKPKTLTSTNIYLGSLCTCNLIALIGLLINSVLYNKFSLYEYLNGLELIMYFYPYIYPLITSSQIASIYLTISVSVNQFITIAFSKYNNTRFNHRNNSNSNKLLKQKDNQIAFLVVFIIILMSLIFCLPYWFTFKYSDEYGLQNTDISKEIYFKQIVHFYMYLPFACVIPNLVLIITNTYLISTLEVTMRRKRRLTFKMKTKTTRTEYSNTSSALNKQEKSLIKKSKQNMSRKIASNIKNRSKTLMLISFVFFFLVCQFPTLLLNLIELDESYKLAWYYGNLAEFSKLLLIVNLSFNFAIFYLFSERFRCTLKNVLFCKSNQQIVI